MPRPGKSLQFWGTANPEGKEKGFMQMGLSFQQHDKVQSLSANAYRVYTYMMIQCRGNCEFTIPYSVCEGFISKPVFYKAVSELERAGFILKLKGSYVPGTPNRYKFSRKYRGLDEKEG